MELVWVFRIRRRSNLRQTRWSPGWPVLNLRWVFSLRRKVFGVEVAVQHRRFWLRPGGRLVGRFEAAIIGRIGMATEVIQQLEALSFNRTGAG
jgi:hypothetical protein